MQNMGILLGTGPISSMEDSSDTKSAYKRRHNKFGQHTDAGNNMDLLKKFRYNFHYWLKNCY